MKHEVWKDIRGYEGLYQVSNKGNVRSLDRTTFTNRGEGFYVERKGKVLAQNTDKDGYMKTILSKEGVAITPFVHRLVAEAFIENPNNYPVINHINEIKNDNRVENIEWCTVAYNNMYNEKARKGAHKQKKPVVGTNEKTGKKKHFESVTSVEKKGFNMSHVIACAKGRRKRHLGHTWEYA